MNRILLVETNKSRLTYEVLKSQKLGKLTSKAICELHKLCEKIIKLKLELFKLSINNSDFLDIVSASFERCIKHFKYYCYNLNKKSETYFISLISYSFITRKKLCPKEIQLEKI
jgi:hypothetical protein